MNATNTAREIAINDAILALREVLYEIPLENKELLTSCRELLEEVLDLKERLENE